MQELVHVPGIIARWARAEDGIRAPPDSCSDQGSAREGSPLGRLERYLGEPIERNPYTGRTKPVQALEPVHIPGVVSPELQQHSSPHILDGQAAQPDGPVALLPAAEMDQNLHPFLRPALLHTYKSRVLVEQEIDGELQYIDRAAIFVGRLVKTQETRESLLKRFAKYGKMVSPDHLHVAHTSVAAFLHRVHRDLGLTCCSAISGTTPLQQKERMRLLESYSRTSIRPNERLHMR